MPRRSASGRRIAALALVVSAHGLIVAALSRPAPERATAPSDQAAQTLLLTLSPAPQNAVAPAPKATAKATRPRVSPSGGAVAGKAAETAPEDQNAASSSESAPQVPDAGTTVTTDDAAWSEGSCDVLAVLQGRLQSAQAVKTALRALPLDTRSVANAVMLWDGEWRTDSHDGPLTLIRVAVSRALADAPGACLAADVIGPRLIMLRDERGTTLLAVGSGVWTWSQVLASAPTTLAVAK